MKNTVGHQSILMIQIKLDNFGENMNIRQTYFQTKKNQAQKTYTKANLHQMLKGISQAEKWHRGKAQSPMGTLKLRKEQSDDQSKYVSKGN